LEQAEGLDRVVGPVQQVVQKIPPGWFKDALHGVWLGHPVHPMLVQVPLGAFMSAGFLDALGSDGERQARHLIGLGLLASVPAAMAGGADWAEQHEQQMRTGVVHAAANTAAITLYAGSLLARGRQRAGLGKALGYAGLVAVSLGGLLGGDISYRQAGGANHAEEVPHLVTPGWQDLMPAGDLKQGEPVQTMLGEVPVFVLRDGDEVHVLANKCSHMSGPLSDGELSDGELTGDREDRCITCPWHGSVFRVRNGAVVHGPATADQPAFETRIQEGIVQVCLPGAG
ncbi:MAG TPA: Rieske 2Fe-2S domain-containing protein, partial [Streptosporangiaceae bacterium]|nr:Rieske 2Fe-2S domain-containing protein [Streptosporangiaceae bacterium]